MTTPIRRLAVLILLAVVAGGAVAAQASIPISGTLTDDQSRPLEGYRIVFRNTGTVTVFLSEPAGPDGRFRAELPEGQGFVCVAVIDPVGVRTTVEGAEPFMVEPGLAPAIVVPMGDVVEAPEAAFPGSDRLFLSFVEDSAIVAGQRYEARLDFGGADAGDTWLTSFVAAVQLASIPRVEFGGRIGYATIDLPSGSESGVTDTDLWAKFLLGRTGSGRTELAVGAVATLPTGDEDSGTGFDALRSEVFGAARFAFPSFVVTTTLGLRVNEDGEAFGVRLDGQVAPSLGAGVVVPLWGEAGFVGEMRWEGERFDGTDASGEVLAGVNWRPLPNGAARLAVGAGFDDGAPDWRVVLGYAFEF